MIRTLVWLVSGVLLGGIIHLIVILMLPTLASNDTWSRIAALDTLNHAVVLPDVTDDDHLLLRLNRREESVIIEVYQRYFPPLYQYIRLKVGDRSMAQDIVSEVDRLVRRNRQRGEPRPERHRHGTHRKHLGGRHCCWDMRASMAALPTPMERRILATSSICPADSGFSGGHGRPLHTPRTDNAAFNPLTTDAAEYGATL